MEADGDGDEGDDDDRMMIAMMIMAPPARRSLGWAREEHRERERERGREGRWGRARGAAPLAAERGQHRVRAPDDDERADALSERSR